MSVCLFIGPTLTVQETRAICPDAICLPPVRQGDVHRVAMSLRPEAMGIVDGYFTHVPSVWHKEILHAMTEGIPVYGAASMGALRAAELAQFGMVGIGRIFEAYRDGVLAPYDEPFEDDDEVAVLHGPADLGYFGLSEVLVNIRCTLARATEDRIIGPTTRDRLVRAGKALFYQERSYEAIMS
ncbi:MAG: TfuA-like protein, partial [Geminicoccales bacterium]